MNLIPLYDVKPFTNIPSDITRRHWRDEAEQTERLLADFLGLDDSADVLLLDRATHALELAYRWVNPDMITIPSRTYRAALDAARCVEVETILEPDAQMQLFPGRDDDYFYTPTTLGGTNPMYTRSLLPYVYDCAHTCYRGMLGGWEPHPYQFVALSFYPTKPLGALGGGALIGHRCAIKQLRPIAWPIAKTTCHFYYPQSVQSWAIRQRLAEWDEEHWRMQRVLWQRTADWVLSFYNLEFAWPQPGAVVVSPHLLAFRGPDVEKLRFHCQGQQIECGDHYPPLDGEGPPHITVPFHTDEVATRLQRVTRVFRTSAQASVREPRQRDAPSCPSSSATGRSAVRP